MKQILLIISTLLLVSCSTTPNKFVRKSYNQQIYQYEIVDEQPQIPSYRIGSLDIRYMSPDQ